MNILTLTTDKGFNDIYLASYKGLLFKKKQDINIIDISATIEPFNLQQSSFILSNSWSNFPIGTVHNFRVGEELLKKNHFLIFEMDEQIFLVPDNGVITMLFPYKKPKEVFRVSNEMTSRSNSEFLATIISYIFESTDFSIVGTKTTVYKELMNQLPISSENYIRGIIQYVDGYGNLISNISKQLFKQQQNNRNYKISLRNISFNELSTEFPSSDGDICFFNNMGLLQVSLYQGNAAELYNLGVYDNIQIDFKANLDTE